MGKTQRKSSQTFPSAELLPAGIIYSITCVIQRELKRYKVDGNIVNTFHYPKWQRTHFR